MGFVNLTPHDVVLNDGTVLPPSGVRAMVEDVYTPFDENGITHLTQGDITNLPPPADGVVYVTSAMVASKAAKEGRTDVVSPATGHRDCVRKDGKIVSVPGFVSYC